MLPQHITYQRNGTVSVEVPFLPSAATIRIVDGSGSEVMNHRLATISTINTGLQVAANVGNWAITVNANTGAAAGLTAWLQDDPEEIAIRQVAGTTLHLRRPLLLDHASGARIEGGRIAYDVNADFTNSLFFDGRCEWNIDGSLYFTDVECGRYPNRRLASTQDLFDCEPRLQDVISRGVDPERLLNNAHELVLGEVAKRAPDQRTRLFVGSMGFKQATAAMAMYTFYIDRQGDAKEAWWAEFERRLATVITVTPRDADQDGTIEAEERMSSRTVKVRR